MGGKLRSYNFVNLIYEGSPIFLKLKSKPKKLKLAKFPKKLFLLHIIIEKGCGGVSKL